MNWRGYLQFGRLAWASSRTMSILTVTAVVVAAVTPLAAVAAVGAVVTAVTNEAMTTALWWTVVAGGFFLLRWASAAVQSAVAGALGERIDSVLQRDLMSAVMTPAGIEHLENPDTLDLINVGRDTFRSAWSRPGRMASTLSGLAAGRVVLLGSCLIVAGFHPLLGVLVLAGGLWAAYEDKVASRIEAAHHHGGTEWARRTEYYYDLGVTPAAAKEIRVFGLSGFVLDRFRSAWNRSMSDIFAPTSVRPLMSTAVLGIVILGGIAWIVGEALAGRIGVGPATIYLQALMVALGGIQQSSWSGLQTELALATLRRYSDAIAVVRPGARETGEAADHLPRKEIRFSNVSFSYPGSDTDALQGLDLVIPAGQSLAIVGANGAGKSTVVNLLCRMYEPTSGCITVDGTDLSTLDVPGWRRRLAAVFQDSTRFGVSARSTVEFGRIDSAGDLVGIEMAAKSAGIAVDQFPRGWDTPLSPDYADGVDLSGGEWQKIGLARALFAVNHGASVLILDEPAAHLDARAEAQLYQRFLSITEGITTIVISHRFSTVRQASSIVVIDDGKVIERGSHDELINVNGAYAEMFRLQASRFGAGQ